MIEVDKGQRDGAKGVCGTKGNTGLGSRQARPLTGSMGRFQRFVRHLFPLEFGRLFILLRDRMRSRLVKVREGARERRQVRSIW